MCAHNCVGFVLLRSAALLLLIVIATIGSTAASAQNAPAKNPFGVPMPNTAQQPAKAQTKPSFFTRLWIKIRQTQAKLHRDLAKAVKRIKTEETFMAGFGLVLLSFIYGVVHAVGPGHGKAVISSYVLANERTVRRGIILAILASLVQAVTAITLVLILAAILNASGILIKSTERYLESASYAAIALVGIWLVLSVMRKIFANKDRAQNNHHHSHEHGAHHHHHGHDHNHDHAHDHAHHHHDHKPGEVCEDCGHVHLPDPSQLEDNWSWQKALAIIFAIGIRPCSGAVIVLVFALAQGLFWAGIASTFAMSIGTAITVSILAVLAVGSKKIALSLASGGSTIWVERTYLTLALIGSILVLFLGVSLFISSLGPARPF